MFEPVHVRYTAHMYRIGGCMYFWDRDNYGVRGFGVNSRAGDNGASSKMWK